MRTKHLKKCVKLNRNFQRGWGGGVSVLWGRYEYFLELHIILAKRLDVILREFLRIAVD